MSTKKYQTKLTVEQRQELKKLTTSGIASARKINRARIVLLSDEDNPNGSRSDKEIAEILNVSRATVVRIRQRFIEQGLAEALGEKPRSGKPPQLSGKQKAQVTALACSKPPTGYARWTLRLLAAKLVELEMIEAISHKTVGEILKKMNSSLICIGNGV
jgi:transposase